jgi:hypothetical protein
MSGWQPIETAPKDGTHVIIFDPSDSRPREAVFDTCYGQWVDPIEAYDEYSPTHWMPLPAPPEVSA